MPPRPGKRRESLKPSRAAPRWLRPLLLVLSVLVLLGFFSKEISDTDFWWHLKTGQYMWQTHSLPDPDPFAYTTATVRPAYAGEEVTRHFNLTHEWLAQILLYFVYSIAGFAGIVLFRAAILTAFCACAGLVAYGRCGGFYRSLAASFAAAAAVAGFASDRPYLITFLLLAAMVVILESGKPAWLWALPLLMLVWANCHGGFVLGWMVLCAWCAEAIYLRLKGLPAVGDFRLYAVSAVSILVSGINPNGFRVLEVLANYQQSLMTATLAEWRPPLLWPPTPFSVLLAAAAVALAVARRRVRPADWLLFTAFAVAGLSAGRNTFLIALLAPILIAAYVPWKRTLHAYAQVGVALLLAGGFAVEIAEGRSFQLRAAEWQFPARAADFLLAHHITQPIFNTYEDGGYLIWRLWPQERVFIDGRALSESLFQDYVRILAYSGDSDGPGAEQLPDRYGVRAVVMNGFDYAGGQRYPLALGLVNLEDSPWRLVYADPQALRICEILRKMCRRSIRCRYRPCWNRSAGCISNASRNFPDVHAIWARCFPRWVTLRKPGAGWESIWKPREASGIPRRGRPIGEWWKPGAEPPGIPLRRSPGHGLRAIRGSWPEQAGAVATTRFLRANGSGCGGGADDARNGLRAAGGGERQSGKRYGVAERQ